MARDNERLRLFTRRAVILGGVKTALLSVLAGRIYYLQVLQGDRFRTLADENRISTRLIAPPRGQVLDQSGVPLAVNQQNYRAVLLPEQVSDPDKLLKQIGAYLPLGDNDRRRIERELRKDSGLNAVLIYDNLTWDQVSALSLNAFELGGVEIEVGEVRTYPYSDTIAHIVGYVGAVSPAERETSTIELKIPGYRIGKSGVERQYDRVLRGEPGNVQLEVNARGRVVRELARKEPKVGRDVELSIDIGLQQYVHRRVFEEQSASVAVLDVHTGAVYALVSHPSFDPNLFTYGINQTDWDRLNGDERAPLLNKAVDGLYAPGSTFKIITALAGLDAGQLNPKASVFCPGYFELGDHRFHCWKRGGHGHVNFRQAMAGSCDTYFYEIGKRVGIDKIQAMAKRFGLGAKTEIDLPFERSGLVPSRAWKMATRNSSWQLGETLIASIGQGYLLTTPMQLALMTARLVNGGKAIKPHLVPQHAALASPRRWPSLQLERDHIELVRDSLDAVVCEPIGTAYAARIMDEKMAMGGKTGTSQVKRITMAEREEGLPTIDKIPWRERDHALFVGYAPTHAPQYAVAVVVDHGGSGAGKAAPIARDILAECQKRNLAKGA